MILLEYANVAHRGLIVVGTFEDQTMVAVGITKDVVLLPAMPVTPMIINADAVN